MEEFEKSMKIICKNEKTLKILIETIWVVSWYNMSVYYLLSSSCKPKWNKIAETKIF